MRATPIQIYVSASETFLRSAQNGSPLSLELLPELFEELHGRNNVNNTNIALAAATARKAVGIVNNVYAGRDTLMRNGHPTHFDLPEFDEIQCKTALDHESYTVLKEQIAADTSVISGINMDLRVHDIHTAGDCAFLTEFQVAAGVGLNKMALYSCDQQLILLLTCVDVLLTRDVYDALLAKQIQTGIVHLVLMFDSVCQHNHRICEVYDSVVYQLQCVKTILSQMGTALFAAPGYEWMDAVVCARAIKTFNAIAPTDFLGYNHTPLIAPRSAFNCGTYAQPTYSVVSL